MSIKSNNELEKMRSIGGIVARALAAMAKRVLPGITTGELNEIGARVLAENGARSAPPMVYGYPADVCISVNDEAMHGIPGGRTVQPGDLVKLDLVAEKDGFFADAAVSVNAAPASAGGRSLAHCAERAFRRALGVARAGNRVYEIGREVEREVRRSGYSVIRELCGHGVGRTIHEQPSVPNFPDRAARARLTEGLVITIEPVIAAGNGRARLEKDGWTFRTEDGSLAAHYEHTVVITRAEPILLTVA
ncbi:MAG TPA: type I methionyl aminopeptidase [Bryobacteraceae bacterium]|nr:type I methionyl aminopeptidase [Bryobacteraceae bacterium]